MSPEDAKTIGDAVKALDDAMRALDAANLAKRKAQAGLEALEGVLLKALPAGRPVHIAGTQYTLISDGTTVTPHREEPVLTLEDLAK